MEISLELGDKENARKLLEKTKDFTIDICYSELGQYGLAQESYKKGMMLDMEAKSKEKTFEKTEEKSED